MTCREVDEALLTSLSGGLSPQAQAHLASCEACRNLASTVAAGASSYKVPAGLLERVRDSIPSSLARVQPLAPTGFWVVLFLLAFSGIGVGTAGGLGIYGWLVLSTAARVLIFSVLVGLSILTAFATARRMRPGPRTLRSGVLLAGTILALEAVFFILFRDYSQGRFFRSGLNCLGLGLLTTVPAGVLMWLLVRRGYILAPVSAGVAIGGLAGLTGLFALELHCPILTIPHVAVWHAAVPAISAALGAAGGWIGSRTRSASRRA